MLLDHPLPLQQADTALQQERAMFAANQSLHTGLTSMAQMMDSGMQAQLRDVQEQLREKERLEREAQERLREEERRSRELVQRCERLEGKLERRTQHLASLQQAMQQPDDGTPARGVSDWQGGAAMAWEWTAMGCLVGPQPWCWWSGTLIDCVFVLGCHLCRWLLF